MKSSSGMYDPRGSESTCPGPSRFSTVVNSLERDGLRQAFLPQIHRMKKTTTDYTIPDRSSPGSARTAPFIAHEGEGVKWATDDNNKLRTRSNISIGTWNVRTLRPPGKLEELTHEMRRYRWSVLGLCEVRWRNSGETTAQDGHKLYFSGKEDRHENGVGFLVHKDAVNTVMGCQPISSRLITIRLRATPFNTTVVQAYAPTTDYDDDKIEGFYEQLQEVVDQIPKKDILIVQGDWNAKVGKDACKNWKYTCGLFSNNETNERGLRLLKFASLNDLKLANTFGPHKASRRWTWHSPNGKHHNQIDYIMIKRRFQTSVNIAKTSFPGADIGSDHDLVMMTFKLHLKKVSKQGHSRIRFDLEKLKDPEVAETFKAMIGGKCAPLTLLDADDVSMDDFINKFNVAVTETANETLGKYRHHKQPWVTPNILHLCNKRRELKKDKFTTEGASSTKQ